MTLRELLSRVIVINLDEDRARWEAIQEEFRRSGLPPPSRFPAVSGRTLSEDERRRVRYKRRDRHSFASDGHIGCAMSHAAVWRQALASGAPFLTVLEDDVTFTPALPELLDVELPDDWAILYLGHCRGGWLRNAAAAASQPAYDAPRVAENIYAFSQGSGGPVGGYAYALSLPKVRSLVESYDFQQNSDLYLAAAQRDVKVYGLYPNAVVHNYRYGSRTAAMNALNSAQCLASYLTNTSRHLPFVVPWALVFAALVWWSGAAHVLTPWALVLIARVGIDFRRLRAKVEAASRGDLRNIPGFFGINYYEPFGEHWDPRSREQATCLLDQLFDTCRGAEVRAFLTFGTLLGWARHDERLIPWDDDIDVAVDRRDLARLLDALRARPELRVERRLSIGCGVFFKIYAAGSDAIWPFVDLWPFDLRDGRRRVTWSVGNFARPAALREPLALIPAQFEGVSVMIPAQWRDMLRAEYGERWASECVSSVYCHRIEEEIDARYVLRLEARYLGVGVADE